MTEPHKQAAPPPDYSTAERNAINRAVHVRSVLHAEGWAHILKILDEIIQEAQDRLENYKGTDDHETATLAFIWKTLKAHKTKLLATIQAHIEEGEQVALAKVRPLAQMPETDQAIAFPVVKPACDVEEEAG